MKRDSQRSKVHASVKIVAQKIGQPLPQMTDINAFVKRVLSRATLVRRYDAALLNIGIKDGRGYSAAIGNRHMITVPTCHRSAIYVLRSLAYTIQSRMAVGFRNKGSRSDELRGRDAPWHGWQHCSILMDLVRYGLGESEAEVLRQTFVDKKVRWSKPTERTLTDEQKVVMQKRGKDRSEGHV